MEVFSLGCSLLSASLRAMRAIGLLDCNLNTFLDDPTDTRSTWKEKHLHNTLTISGTPEALKQ